MKPDPSVPKKCSDRLLVAKVLVSTTWPYLTAAVMRLQARWSREVPTLGVDRYLRLYLNPDYVATLDAPMLALLIAGHELQHVLGKHSERLTAHRGDETSAGGHSASFANVCHDLAINSGLQSFIDSARVYRASAGLQEVPYKMPAEGLFPHQFADKKGKPLPPGLISEEYADLLKHLVTPQCGKARGHSCGSGGGDAKQPWEEGDPDPSDPSSGAIETEVDTIASRVAQAAAEQASKNRGSVPSAVRIWAEKRIAPVKVPWPTLLRRAIRSGIGWNRGQREWSWVRLSRTAPPNVLLPSTVDPEPDFVVVMDTSGSMGPEDYDLVFRHIHAIIRAAGIRKVPVVACDAKVHAVQYVTKVSEIEVTGGGGTDMAAGIAAAVELGKRFVIVLTDTITPWGPEPKGVRVLVAATQKPTSSYPVPDWAKLVECFD